jgi:hypothetical protein
MNKNDSSDDAWDNDDFEPNLSTPLTNVQISQSNLSLVSTLHDINENTSQDLPITIVDEHEVEVKYPGGNKPKSDVLAKRNHSGGKLSSSYFTIDEFEKLKKDNPDTDSSALLNKVVHVAKIEVSKTVQGSSKTISKIDLINNVINNIDNFTKETDFIKFSQNWSRPLFQNEVFGNIKKKDKFKYCGMVFSIKNTLYKLNDINQYFLTQRKPADKISILTKKKTKCDDLTYTLYKIIIYIIYNSIRYKGMDCPLDKYDIFEIFALIKLLKINDTITLHYLINNY